MYKITWVDGNRVEECKNKQVVNNHVDGMGSDGAIIKWINDDNAIINFYNEIVAYVTYFEPLVPQDFAKIFLELTLKRLTQEQLQALMIEYNAYVQDNIKKASDVGVKSKNVINDLLYYATFVWEPKDV